MRFVQFLFFRHALGFEPDYMKGKKEETVLKVLLKRYKFPGVSRGLFTKIKTQVFTQTKGMVK